MSFWEDAANTLKAQEIFYDLKGKSESEMFEVLDAAFKEHKDTNPDVLNYLCQHISNQAHLVGGYEGVNQALLAAGILQFVRDNF